MKPVDDLSFQDASKLEFDHTAYFEKLWRELDELEKRLASWTHDAFQM